ncbi:hypothetical protein [Klebsiella spallanzanii]|uniref:hypothetical protein n=1 Tax=Klebsiella spallanzanii TaxID=2587528 RepID=UPI0011573CA4|nr:hypothetical protein [Klebsiella spallanzanii]VUS27535.1 hypothetical protein SB6419_05421 [Klebsiella spallanzanii]
MDIAWYLFAFVWLYTPWIFVLVSILLVGMFFWRHNPMVSCLFFCQWLPQIIVFGIVYAVWLQGDTGAFESVTPSFSTSGLVSMLAFWWLSRRMTKTPAAGGSMVSTNREAPDQAPKTMDVKKPGSPSQDNRVKINSCFLNASGLAGMSRN